MTSTARHSLSDLFVLAPAGEDRFRAEALWPEPFPLYGGQVAAQALYAAALTVREDRRPHAFHAHYLLPGDTARPLDFRVERDRDGRSFSSRRVVVTQGGAPVVTLAASFHTGGRGPDRQFARPPRVTPPGASERGDFPRLSLVEWRQPEQEAEEEYLWPPRLWARPPGGLPEGPVATACALAYVSDASMAAMGPGGPGTGITLNHSVWFHRLPAAADWTLLDLSAGTVSDGRGWYTGALYAENGRLLASLAQEVVYRSPRAA
ncbi:thioesterase family protein [Streptomyces sp. DSM 44917]|uniref:Thioesterase family protein n=1 Tax=Streptomyces boetiae TaxID=3075541 RepID=A0ABU2LEB4_9ACTN|nr:acyl-CoA thioesterase domain-containing protein [Streptomyces sp. DSM 44917]MDT0309518.1 thioesterase family protein [Streptomyces sp. DSM 44917]